MCGFKAYYKVHEILSDSVSSGSGRLLPEGSTTYFIKSLGVSLKFIDTYLKLLESNYAWCCVAYQESMIKLSKNITTTKHTPTLK